MNALRETQAADYLGLSKNTLRASRVSGSRVAGPPFVKLGRRVVYLQQDLDVWLAAQRRTPQGP